MRIVVRRGLTLVEVLVAVGLIGVLLTVLLTFLWHSLELRDRLRGSTERMQVARVVLDRIAAELRGTVGIDRVGFPVERRLAGDRRSLTFLTTALPAAHQYRMQSESEAPPPAQHDLVEVGYRLLVDPEQTDAQGEPAVHGIVRSEKRTLNQFLVDEEDPLDVRYDLWAPELRYLEFRYYDGVEWDTVWDATLGNSLPQLVQITVGFSPVTRDELEDRDLEQWPLEEYPLGPPDPRPDDRFRVLVRLPAADRFFSSRIERIGRRFSEQLGLEGLP